MDLFKSNPVAAAAKHAWLSAGNVASVVVYLALLGGGVFAMQHFRAWALQTYSSPSADEEWDRWRTESKRLADRDGPVERSAAKSNEPPALILARDYYGVLLSGTLVLGSVLFFVVVVLVRGAVRSSSPMSAENERATVSDIASDR